MKVDYTEESATILSNTPVLENIKMTASEKALPHLVALMSKLYNDPEGSVFREYLANALDAHTAAGNEDEPIDIYLPTSEAPIFTVKDYGIGMSLDTVRTIYSQYGESTKNVSDDEIGGFGLGCKSALAISSQFTIRTIKDGTLIDAIVRKANSGFPDLDIVKLDKTDLPDGTSIAIPVSNPDSFTRKAVEYLVFLNRPYNVHNYFGTPIRSFETMGDELVGRTDLGDDIFVSIRHDTRYSGVGYSSGFRLVMGGIYYLIADSELFPNLTEDVRDLLEGFSGSSVIIEAPIGSVDLSPNRESVQFTPKTTDFFNNSMEQIFDKLSEGYRDSIENADTYLKACEAASSVPFAVREVIKEVTWNDNNVIMNPALRFTKGDGDGPGGNLYHFFTRRSTDDSFSTRNSHSTYRLENNPKIVVVYGDNVTRFRRNYTLYSQQNYSDHEKLVYFLLGDKVKEAEIVSAFSYSFQRENSTLTVPFTEESLRDVIGLDVDFAKEEEIAETCNKIRREERAEQRKLNPTERTRSATRDRCFVIDDDADVRTTMTRSELVDLADDRNVYYVSYSEAHVSGSTDLRNFMEHGNKPSDYFSDVLWDVFGEDSMFVFQSGKTKMETVKSRYKNAKSFNLFKGEKIKSGLKKALKKDLNPKNLFAYLMADDSTSGQFIKAVASSDISSKDVKDPIFRKVVNTLRDDSYASAIRAQDYSRYSRVNPDIDPMNNIKHRSHGVLVTLYPDLARARTYPILEHARMYMLQDNSEKVEEFLRYMNNEYSYKKRNGLL